MMSLPNSISEPQIKYLYQILEEIEKGELFMPKFQRNFIWNDEQRLNLLRSIKSGIPIGNHLVWRTNQHDLVTFEHIAGIPVPTPPKRHSRVLRAYLLDGQQRLSTLFGALKRPVSINYQAFKNETQIIDINTIDVKWKNYYDLELTQKTNIVDEVDWRIYYDLEAEDFLLLKSRKKPELTWMPVNILIDSFALLRFLRSLKNEALRIKADQLSKMFFDCIITLVSLESNDLEQATTAFQRLNSGCLARSELGMITALNQIEQFDLQAKILDIQEKLFKVGWETLDDKWILSACKASLELDLCQANVDDMSYELKEDPEMLDEVADSFIQVAQFLQTCGIYTPQMLPYSYQSVLLAEAFRTNPSPNNAVLKALSLWLWRTAYTEELSGLNDANMQRALEEILSIANGEVYPVDNLKEKIAPLPKRFNFNASRAKLLASRLAELKPQAINGEPLPVGELLGLQGKNTILRLLPNLSSPENCFIVEPKAFFQFRDYLLKTETKTWETDFLRSHAISDAAAQALKHRSYDQFLSERRQTLIELEKSFIQPLGLDYDLGSTAD
jgi:hypothetical protein